MAVYLGGYMRLRRWSSRHIAVVTLALLGLASGAYAICRQNVFVQGPDGRPQPDLLMAKFILKRFLYALLLLLIASVLIFYGLRVAPGDVTGSIVGVTGTEVLVNDIKERLGLNEPLATQYFIFEAAPAMKAFGALTFAAGFAMTLFEAFVAALQAYIFVVLTAVYISLSVEEEH